MENGYGNYRRCRNPIGGSLAQIGLSAIVRSSRFHNQQRTQTTTEGELRRLGNGTAAC